MLVPALALAPLAHAETQYVIEQLVVNVNSTPDSSGERVATIKSGDAVEVLDKQGDQLHVHLANGTEGWVRKSYLSTQEPLQHRLNERSLEIDKLKQDVARLEGELASARARTRAGGQASAVIPAPVANATAPAASGVSPGAKPAVPADKGEGTVQPTSGEPSYFMTPPEEPARPAWHWALGSFVLALGLGFVLGWQVLDRRIRRKYGGLRIY
jgi:hypothetical protein